MCPAGVSLRPLSDLSTSLITRSVWRGRGRLCQGAGSGREWSQGQPGAWSVSSQLSPLSRCDGARVFSPVILAHYWATLSLPAPHSQCGGPRNRCLHCACAPALSLSHLALCGSAEGQASSGGAAALAEGLLGSRLDVIIIDTSTTSTTSISSYLSPGTISYTRNTCRLAYTTTAPSCLTALMRSWG